MNIDITGRQIEVTPALRDFAEDKLRKLTKLLDEPLDVHIVLAIEKHRHMAEIQVKSRSGIFSSMHETGDLYASIGEVADKLERQALKHKEKLQDHKHRKGHRNPEIAAAIEANETDAVAVAPAAEPVDGKPVIFRSERYRLKPMSAEDAALELESSGDEILVFRSAETDRVAVIYRVQGREYGLIEPEF
jgi:putative sigma-54 modulation protein